MNADKPQTGAGESDNNDASQEIIDTEIIEADIIEAQVVDFAGSDGQGTNRNQAAQDPSAAESDSFSRLLNSKWLMLAMLFGATGFLGIPFLFMSRAFSWWEKILWSLLVTAYTLGLLWGTYAVLAWSMRTISDALG